jgi:hypothetical protein
MFPTQRAVRCRIGLRLLRTGFAFLLVVASSPSVPGLSLAAGAPHERTGFVIGGDLGTGELNIAGHTLDNRPAWQLAGVNWVDAVHEWGTTDAFRVGFGVSNRFVLGVELLGWSERGSLDGYGVLMPTLTFFPGIGGVYARGGVGHANGNRDPNGSGTGALAALGYELW